MRIEVLREIVKRAGTGAALDCAKADLLMSYCFTEQRKVIESKARRKAKLCSRRSGKTDSAVINLLTTCLRRPSTYSLYGSLTKDSCKLILLPKIEEWLDRLEIKARFNSHEMVYKLHNGSSLLIFGFDADENKHKKALGNKYAAVEIDECQDFSTDLRSLVMAKILPATADLRGTITLNGTPGKFVGYEDHWHFFYSVCEKGEPGWEVHRWNSQNNPHVRDAVLEHIEEIRSSNPKYLETPEFRREWLGIWELDTSNLVYAHNKVIDSFDILSGNWSFIGGIDMGFEDSSSFSVVGWEKNKKELYVFESYGRPGMDLTDVSHEVRMLEAKYKGIRWVIDGASKQGIQELRNRKGLVLESSPKAGKNDFIKLLNGDFRDGNVIICRDGCYQLLSEYAKLVWDRTKTPAVEKEGCQNHCADSLLYAWRKARNYNERPNEEVNLSDEDRIAQILERADRRNGKNNSWR